MLVPVAVAHSGAVVPASAAPLIRYAVCADFVDALVVTETDEPSLPEASLYRRTTPLVVPESTLVRALQPDGVVTVTPVPRESEKNTSNRSPAAILAGRLTVWLVPAVLSADSVEVSITGAAMT